jgi:hypothetical protein
MGSNDSYRSLAGKLEPFLRNGPRIPRQSLPVMEEMTEDADRKKRSWSRRRDREK